MASRASVLPRASAILFFLAVASVLTQQGTVAAACTFGPRQKSLGVESKRCANFTAATRACSCGSGLGEADSAFGTFADRLINAVERSAKLCGDT